MGFLGNLGDIFKILRHVFRQIFRRPITNLFPFEDRYYPERTRGRHIHIRTEDLAAEAHLHFLKEFSLDFISAMRARNEPAPEVFFLNIDRAFLFIALQDLPAFLDLSIRFFQHCLIFHAPSPDTRQSCIRYNSLHSNFCANPII